MGGTLLALSDGEHALVSDPDRDRILIVDFVHTQFVGNPIALEAGSLPGRAVEDKAGHAYVVLRGTGEVLTVDVTTSTVTERRAVCATPRGLAIEPAGDHLLIACAEGKLVELPLAGAGRVESKVALDARDVVFAGGKLFVSRFRSAELLELDSARALVRSNTLPSVADQSHVDPIQGALVGVFDPAVAWRAVPGPNGHGVVMVHQRATSENINIAHPDASGGSTKGTGTIAVPTPTDPTLGGGAVAGGSPYGADFSGCGGIVHSAVTIVEDGTTLTSPQLAGVVLPVDVAVSNDGYIAVASAGSDPTSPTVTSFGSSVLVMTATEVDRGSSGDCRPQGFNLPIQDPVVAVAFDPVHGTLLAQTREPAGIAIFDGVKSGTTSQRTMSLGGEQVGDTGHDIFHQNAGAGIACASCHPEGTDDGRTWHFNPTGARRTQPVDVGLAGTAPFHWDGDLPTLGSLMSEVFVARMGGPAEPAVRVSAVEDWLFKLTPRTPLLPKTDEAAMRGKALFESSDVACASCHSGAKFTNSQTVDVGTGGKFQVPSLLGVGQRVPVMHNGCASTLRARFDAACGGTAHGNTSQLSESELGDLVAYLESI